MPEHSTTIRDMAALAVGRAGGVKETGDPLMPFRLVDGQGAEAVHHQHDQVTLPHVSRSHGRDDNHPVSPTRL